MPLGAPKPFILFILIFQQKMKAINLIVRIYSGKMIQYDEQKVVLFNMEELNRNIKHSLQNWILYFILNGKGLNRH